MLIQNGLISKEAHANLAQVWTEINTVNLKVLIPFFLRHNFSIDWWNWYDCAASGGSSKSLTLQPPFSFKSYCLYWIVNLYWLWSISHATKGEFVKGVELDSCAFIQDWSTTNQTWIYFYVINDVEVTKNRPWNYRPILRPQIRNITFTLRHVTWIPVM